MKKILLLPLFIFLMLTWMTGCGNNSLPSTVSPQPQQTIIITPPPSQTETTTATVATDPTPTPASSTSISPQPTTEPTVVLQADPTDQGLNLLVAVSGEVLLKRAVWPNYQPAGFGAGLQRGDLLKVAAGADALILCDNLTLWNVPGGPAPAGLNGCPRPEAPALIRRGVKIAGTRGGDPNVPYIISPRSTKLLDEMPLLRWNAPEGATSYTVQVRGGDIDWKLENVTSTSLTYPGDPPLDPDVFYLLVVEDDLGRSSQDEGTRGLGFSILSLDEAATITNQYDKIDGMDISETARQYAIAQYYSSQGLIAEAIQILEGLVKTDNKESIIHQSLADLYVQIGLWLLAEERYTAAITQANAQANLEVMAASQAKLGEVEIKLGHADEAIEQLTQARNNYETLGEIERIGEIEELLELLK